jgi:demethylmenaquinone methyltransferase/2-methoxy-6-polyprenyl-1,4-benzoquinol methylase
VNEAIHSPAEGSRPSGVEGEQQVGRWVRRMFDGVAPRYDLLNHVLSGNMDRLWRARTVSRLSKEISAPGAVVVDLCCGSGDLMLSLAKRRGATVFGSDFCHPMLIEASRKAAARSAETPLFEVDAMNLPLASSSAGVLTVAFGFRNLANYEKGLREMYRVFGDMGFQIPKARIGVRVTRLPLLLRRINWHWRHREIWTCVIDGDSN